MEEQKDERIEKEVRWKDEKEKVSKEIQVWV